MDYPVFQLPVLGGSMLIAAVAIIHVVIAHFAVGAGLFNAVQESLAIRSGDRVMLDFLRRHSRFLILFSFVSGALTGVGIWFAIALVSPVATSNLIHLFVWAWATEWSLFLIEIVAGYVYYYTWDRLPPRLHNIVGWIYAAAAFGSLVLINGIISFMLTPGRFTGPESFWQNLFNPSFWPSTLIRSISAVSLAAIFVIIVVNYARGFDREQRHRVIRAAARWLIPLVAMVPLGWWYFQSIPANARNFIFNQRAVVMVMLFTFGVAASLLIASYAYLGLLRAGRYVSGETGLLLLGIALMATGSMEFVREGIRKPYVIRPTQDAAALMAKPDAAGLYSTGMPPAQLRQTETDGTLTHAPWERRAAGSDDPAVRGGGIFLRQCYGCHTARGAYNPAAPLVYGWSDDQYESNLRNLHATKDAMPHFRPTPRDREDLMAYLRTLNP